MTRSLLSTAALLALLTLAGCKTAERVYTDAMALETSGDVEAAARAYADALRRDGSLANARGRLAVAGREAVARRIATAGTASTRSGAADEWLAAASLVREAQAVGVTVERPASFEQDVDAACDAAVDALADAGDERAAAGDADAAIGFYDRARQYRPTTQRAAELDRVSVDVLLAGGQSRIASGDFGPGLALLDRARRYRPTADRQRDLDESARDGYADWSAADLAAGRFRAALGHADQALTLAPTGSTVAAQIARLRADVLDAGTVVVAVFPAIQPRTPAGDALPNTFLRDVSDVLLDDRLTEPVPFRLVVDPADTRRALRQSRADLTGNSRLLADLTRDLDADLGMVAEVDGFHFTEAETERRAVTFPRLASGDPAPAVRVTTAMTLRVRAALVATDRSGRRIACDQNAPEVTVSERYDTATSEVAVADLRLRDGERGLFGDGPRDRTYAGLLARLRDRLAADLAARVGACMERQVP